MLFCGFSGANLIDRTCLNLIRETQIFRISTWIVFTSIAKKNGNYLFKFRQSYVMIFTAVLPLRHNKLLCWLPTMSKQKSWKEKRRNIRMSDKRELSSRDTLRLLFPFISPCAKGAIQISAAWLVQCGQFTLIWFYRFQKHYMGVS